MSELYILLSIIGTLLMIGFFAGYEIAFVSANRLSIELKKKQGKKSGIILSNFMENPAKFIGSCLIGLNIFLVIYGLLFDEFLKSIAWRPINFQNDIVKLIVDTLISTIVVLIFGEFIPKAVFKAKSERFLTFFSSIAQFFYTLFEHIATLFVNISQWILKYVFNLRLSESNDAFNKVDLEHFFQQTKEQVEDNQELNTELFENALSLPMVKIRQCLVPRTEIEGVDINCSIEDLKSHFVSTQLSKLVVYDENIDNIMGYVHQLDLFQKPDSVRSIMHPMMAVPESMSAIDLINKFTKARRSIAWVVDEFGGTSGIVTMEDVLEEIFGEIHDEYDVAEFEEKQLTEDEFMFSGRLELDYLNEKYKMDFAVADSETLSGFIINAYETIPTLKETIIIGHYKFDIVAVSDTRIEMVKMKILK